MQLCWLRPTNILRLFNLTQPQEELARRRRRRREDLNIEPVPFPPD